MINVLITSLSDLKKEDHRREAANHLRFWPREVTENSEVDFSSTIGHLLAEQLLTEYKIPLELIHTLHKTALGKWRLDSDALDFNISHSGDKVLAAITDLGLIGIDVEKFRPVVWRDFQDQFSSEEWRLLNESPEPEKMFFEFWARKESLSKAYGLGLQLPFNTVHVAGKTGRVENSNKQGHFYSLCIPGYSAWVCASNDQEIAVRHFDLNSLFG